MYKVSLRSERTDFGEAFALIQLIMLIIPATECLDVVCRSSSKDATLLYACVMEAHSIGDKRQVISALLQVLDKYDYTAPAGIHLSALLR